MPAARWALRVGRRRRRQARSIHWFPIRPRRRGERRSLRTLPGASLRPPLPFNPRPRRLSTSTDAFQLHPDVRSYGTTLRALNKFTIRPAQLKDIQTRLGVDAGPSAAVSAAAAGSSSRPSSHSGVRSGATSSSSSPPATSHASRGHYGGDDRRGHGAPPPASSRPGAGSSRPSTTGGMLRRANSGGIPPADASAAPPPYGAATGSVPRIAEGAPPRPVHVDSERELSQEMDKIATRLNPAKEWTDRIAAMVRIEALLLGGAAEWENFPAILSRLREPLTHQAADRRSAIVRQVAHLLVVLAARARRRVREGSDALRPGAV